MLPGPRIAFIVCHAISIARNIRTARQIIPALVSRRRRNISHPAALPCVTEQDLLDNALELLVQAFRAADEGRFAAARGLGAAAARYFEDAEIIIAAKQRVLRDDAAGCVSAVGAVHCALRCNGSPVTS